MGPTVDNQLPCVKVSGIVRTWSDPCCDVEPCPFVLVRRLAAIVVGMIVYYVFGRAIRARVKALKRLNG